MELYLYSTYSMNFKQWFIGCMSTYNSEIIKITAFYVKVPMLLQCRKVLFCTKTHQSKRNFWGRIFTFGGLNHPSPLIYDLSE